MFVWLYVRGDWSLTAFFISCLYFLLPYRLSIWKVLCVLASSLMCSNPLGLSIVQQHVCPVSSDKSVSLAGWSTLAL